MNLEYVPLLPIQNTLQQMPRDPKRFQQYLRTMYVDGNTLIYPPLSLMNPMARDHVTRLVEAFLQLEADRIASETLDELAPVVAHVPGSFKFGLVVVDDYAGGWTNRYDVELTLRQGWLYSEMTPPRSRWLQDCWVSGILWSSEPATEQAVRTAVRTVVHRTAYLQTHGLAANLRELLRQEGTVMHQADEIVPTLDLEERDYTRMVLAPFLEASDRRTLIECLFGDEAASTLGFTSHGLSHRAGLALAWSDFANDSSPCPSPTEESHRWTTTSV